MNCPKCGALTQTTTGGEVCPKCGTRVPELKLSHAGEHFVVGSPSQGLAGALFTQLDVAKALADLYTFAADLIQIVNSLPAKDEADVPRVDYRMEKQIQEGLKKWLGALGQITVVSSIAKVRVQKDEEVHR